MAYLKKQAFELLSFLVSNVTNLIVERELLILQNCPQSSSKFI